MKVVHVALKRSSLVSLAALENGHLSCPAPLLHISSGSGSVAGLAKPASLESPLSPTLPGSEKGAFHVIASPSRCALNNLTHQNNPTPNIPNISTTKYMAKIDNNISPTADKSVLIF